MPRKSAPPPTFLAFAFSNESTTPSYPITRVRWTQEAHDLAIELSDAYWDAEKKRLPIKDLRLRVQLYDPGTIRVGYALGLGVRFGERENRLLCFSQSNEEKAKSEANRAIVQWTREALPKLDLSESEKIIAGKLQKLAIRGDAAETHAANVPVFGWGTGKNNTAVPAKPYEATAFADLADYAASLLVGKEVFEGRGILRREVGTDLADGSARLVTDPIPVALGRHQAWFSLGLTLKVATYPGRKLPVLFMEVRKQNWTATPTKSFRGRGLSGLAFPEEQPGRAFK